MDTVPTLLVALTAAWVAACGIAARRLLLRSGSPRPQPETALNLAAIGLLAAAPCTYLLLRALMEAPTVVPSTVQLAAGILMLGGAFRARRARLDPQTGSSRFTYPEKSAAIALAAMLVVYGQYFVRTWGAGLELVIPAFIASVVLLIVIMIIGHIVAATLHAPHEELDAGPDERDTAVGLLAIRNAHYTLVAGYWILPILILAPLSVATVLNGWLLFLVVSEVVYYGSLIVGYRVGTD